MGLLSSPIITSGKFCQCVDFPVRSFQDLFLGIVQKKTDICRKSLVGYKHSRFSQQTGREIQAQYGWNPFDPVTPDIDVSPQRKF